MDGIFAAHADSDAFFWKSDSSRRPTQAKLLRLRGGYGRFRGGSRGAARARVIPPRARKHDAHVRRARHGHRSARRVRVARLDASRERCGRVAPRNSSRGGFRLPNGRSAVRNVPRDGVRVVPSPRARPSRVPRVDRPPRTPLRTPPYAPRRARARRRRPRARVRRGPRDRHLAPRPTHRSVGRVGRHPVRVVVRPVGQQATMGRARRRREPPLHPPRPFPQQRRRHPDGGARVHGRDKVSPAPRGSAFAAHRRPATRRHVHGESVVVFLPRKRGHRLGLHPGTSDVKREETAERWPKSPKSSEN